jgi:hypothetical protein
MIDEALFEKTYQAFISANDGGERHRLEAAMAVIAPRLEAAEQMAKALRFVQHRDSRWRDDDTVTPALRQYTAVTQPPE